MSVGTHSGNEACQMRLSCCCRCIPHHLRQRHRRRHHQYSNQMIGNTDEEDRKTKDFVLFSG